MLKRISLALIFTVAATLPSARAQTLKVNKSNRTIEITTSASASQMADLAILHLGYKVYGPTSKAAYAKASETSNAIATALKKAGVAKDQIQSQNQSIHETPTFEIQKLPPAEQAQRKYRVEQSWTVKLKAKDAAKILNLAVADGANNSGNINWQVADPNALEAKAAAKALTHGKQIAAAMAKGLGVTLGPLLYASNQAAQVRPRILHMPRMMAAQAKTEPKPLAINPQRINRSATIHAIFAIQQ